MLILQRIRHGDLNNQIWFGIARNVAVGLLLATSLKDCFLRSSFPPNKKSYLGILNLSPNLRNSKTHGWPYRRILGSRTNPPCTTNDRGRKLWTCLNGALNCAETDYIAQVISDATIKQPSHDRIKAIICHLLHDHRRQKLNGRLTSTSLLHSCKQFFSNNGTFTQTYGAQTTEPPIVIHAICEKTPAKSSIRDPEERDHVYPISDDIFASGMPTTQKKLLPYSTNPQKVGKHK